VAAVVPDPECQDTLRDLLLGLPAVREGKMFGVPAFFVGRKLFACVLDGVVGVKVPEDLAKGLLEDARFEPFRPYGKAQMREWVQFSCAPHDELLSYEEILLAAYEYVSAEAAD
jgi:hypothetical protein